MKIPRILILICISIIISCKTTNYNSQAQNKINNQIIEQLKQLGIKHNYLKSKNICDSFNNSLIELNSKESMNEEVLSQRIDSIIVLVSQKEEFNCINFISILNKSKRESTFNLSIDLLKFNNSISLDWSYGKTPKWNEELLNQFLLPRIKTIEGQNPHEYFSTLNQNENSKKLNIENDAEFKRNFRRIYNIGLIELY